jgi:Tfp pilus assembly pilus retraction ATPase PilT
MDKAANLLQELLVMAANNNSSDIHLVVDSYPIFRTTGKLTPYTPAGIIDANNLMIMITSVMNQNQKEVFLRDLELDFSVRVAGKARFRANAYFQRGTPAISLRYIPDKVPTIAELGLPDICHSFAKLKQGFVHWLRLLMRLIQQGKNIS